MVYEIAGLRIDISAAYAYTQRFCAEYLALDQTSPVDFSVRVSEEEVSKEWDKTPNFSKGYLENICIYRAICRRLPRFRRMLLHCSVLEYDGAGYAFLGESGAGKSTHAALWVQCVFGASILNGDKPIVEYRESGFYAYGTPWNGKENYGKKGCVPLKGLCFLEKATKNAIRLLDRKQTTMRLLKQCLFSQSQEEVDKTLSLVDRLGQMPAYLLECDISEQAVNLAFEKLIGKEYKA